MRGVAVEETIAEDVVDVLVVVDELFVVVDVVVEAFEVVVEVVAFVVVVEDFEVLVEVFVVLVDVETSKYRSMRFCAPQVNPEFPPHTLLHCD